MPTPNDIKHQRDLLKTIRRRVRIERKQQQEMGVHTPAHVVSSIEQGQQDIANIKAWLVTHGETVEVAPEDGDEEPGQQRPTANAPPVQSSPGQHGTAVTAIPSAQSLVSTERDKAHRDIISFWITVIGLPLLIISVLIAAGQLWVALPRNVSTEPSAYPVPAIVATSAPYPAPTSSVAALVLGETIVATMPRPTINPNPADDGDIEALRDEMIVQINAYRAEKGCATPFALSLSLSAVAQLHSEDMARNNFFAHNGSDGSTAQGRAAAAGLKEKVFENIASGYDTVTQTLWGWQSSAAHNMLLLNCESNAAGVGYAFNNESDYTHYWTLVASTQ